MQVTAHKQGTPSWFELSTTDPSSALEFYSGLFGWQDDPQPIPDGEPYHVQRKGEDSVAAISAQMPDEAAQGIPPHWNVYLSVNDLDAVTAKVTDAGGQVIAPPFDVMELGRMAVISDPTGGIVCLWQAGTNIGAGRVNEAGAPSWAELVTPDPARAAAFFETVLGVQTAAGAQPPGAPPYTLIKVDGEDVAGIMQLTPEMGQMPTVWTAYFGVDDADASAERVQALGGQVMVPPTDIPDGRFAVAADRQQVVFGLYQEKEA